MDDIVYFCKEENADHWDKYSDHAYRPINGVAWLYAYSVGLRAPVVICIKTDPSPGADFETITL